MVKVENYIPNFLTFCNLFCGFLGVVSAIEGNLVLAGWLVFAGALFDLFDGLAARMLKVSSPMGVQLDSLVDMVTFGLLPGIIGHKLIMLSHANYLYTLWAGPVPFLSLLPFLLTMGAAWRLARFNLGGTPSHYFQGMPTPTMAMFFASLPLIADQDLLLFQADVIYLSYFVTDPFVVGACVLLFSWLMISTLPLLSLKSKNLTWTEAWHVYILGISALILFALFYWAAIPVIVIIYLILSLFSKPASTI